jgi:hypothetical protein
MWLPALGAVLFLLAAIAWTMSPSTPTGASESTTAAAAAPQPAASASTGIIAKPFKMPRQPIPGH